MQPLVIRFVCPDKDSFHEGIEYTSYLLIPGYEFYRKTKEHGGYEYTYWMKPNPEAFIFVDEPEESWETAINSMVVDAEFIKYPHVCSSCRKRGIKS